MRTSDSIDQLATALSAAQAKMKNATLNKVNPHFRSKYADLAQIRDAVTPALTEQGLAVIHGTDVADGALFVITRLAHKSGQWVEARFPINQDKPQAMGSAITYARRYNLSAITNIAADEDDDANVAQEAKPSKVTPHPERSFTEPDTAAINGSAGISKNKNAKEAYDRLIRQMRDTNSIAGLKEWLKVHRSEVEALPEEWLTHFDDDYAKHKDNLSVTA